jgi:hypothetical protein
MRFFGNRLVMLLEGKRKMAAVLFRCPETSKTIDPALETDRGSFPSLRSEEIKVNCPHCGKTHHLRVSEGRLRERRIAGGRHQGVSPESSVGSDGATASTSSEN